jgi:hypothetical protein
MADEKKPTADGFDEANAQALAEMLMDPKTSAAVRLQIINELNEASRSQTFFEAMFNDELSVGRCPHCAHQNHWLVPEDVLNEMGYVSAEKDPRVKKQTSAVDCPQLQECCMKKKTSA